MKMNFQQRRWASTKIKPQKWNMANVNCHYFAWEWMRGERNTSQNVKHLIHSHAIQWQFTLFMFHSFAWVSVDAHLRCWKCIFIFIPTHSSFNWHFQVHVIMYSYYFAALFGPEVQRKLEGIKRNITLIQMVIFHVSTMCAVDYPAHIFIHFLFCFSFYRPNLQSFSSNAHFHWHAAVKYQRCCSPFTYQIFSWYSTCSTDSSTKHTKKNAIYRRPTRENKRASYQNKKLRAYQFKD